MQVETLNTGLFGVNTYLIIEGGHCAVVDPGGDEKKIVFRAASAGAKIEMILITHMHFDHIGGVDELAAATGAAVYAPFGEMEAGPDSEKNLSMRMGHHPVRMCWPTVFPLYGNEELTLGNTIIQVISTPGHSADGMSFLIDDAIFTGDTLMAGTVGRTDLGHGDMDKLLSCIRNKILTLPESTRVYSGHTGPTTVGHEKNTNPFLQGENLWE